MSADLRQPEKLPPMLGLIRWNIHWEKPGEWGRVAQAGNRLLRFLLGEAAHMAARSDDQLREFFKRLSAKHGTSKAVVATARKLLIRCFIMLRDEIDYLEFRRRGIEVRSAPHLHIGQK